MFGELWRYRHLLYMLAWRDIRIRYKQSVMGLAWALFMPGLYIAAGLVVGRVAKIQTPVPYPLFLLIGVLPWTFFVSGLKFGTTSLVSNINLVTKIYFPREVFPLAAVGACLADLLVGLALLAAALGYYGITGRATVSAWAMLAPAILLVEVLLTAGAAFVLSAANLFLRDVRYVVEAVLMVGVFVTAVYYPLDGWFNLNPLTGILNALRAVLCYGQPPDWAALAGVSAGSLGLFLLGWWAFHRSEYAFAENI